MNCPPIVNWPPVEQLPQREAAIKAMTTLLDHYTGESPMGCMPCPLCHSVSDCFLCPWTIMTGKNCSYASEDSIGTLRRNPTREWRARRIAELTAWIAYYTEGTLPSSKGETA